MLQFVHCRIPENAVALGRIVSMAEVELLEKRAIPIGPRALTSASMPARRNSAGVAVLPSIVLPRSWCYALWVPFCRIFDPDRQFPGFLQGATPKPVIRSQECVDRGTFRACNVQSVECLEAQGLQLRAALPFLLTHDPRSPLRSLYPGVHRPQHAYLYPDFDRFRVPVRRL